MWSVLNLHIETPVSREEPKHGFTLGSRPYKLWGAEQTLIDLTFRLKLEDWFLEPGGIFS